MPVKVTTTDVLSEPRFEEWTKGIRWDKLSRKVQNGLIDHFARNLEHGTFPKPIREFVLGLYPGKLAGFGVTTITTLKDALVWDVSDLCALCKRPIAPVALTDLPATDPKPTVRIIEGGWWTTQQRFERAHNTFALMHSECFEAMPEPCDVKELRAILGRVLRGECASRCMDNADDVRATVDALTRALLPRVR